MLTESAKTAARRAKHCEERYKYKLEIDPAILTNFKPPNQEDVTGDGTPSILRSEVIKAIQQMKNNKSPGIENVTGELLKAGRTV